MTPMMRVWASGFAAVAVWASAAAAHEVGQGTDPAAGSGVRRPAGVPPFGIPATGVPPAGAAAAVPVAQPPPPTPRPLTPAELDELRQRMLGNTERVILKPGEIQNVRRSVQNAQGAGNFPGRDGRMPRPEPRLLSVTQEISRSAPETLHLAYGVVSPITFVDGKGAPWPIASVAYDPRLFAQDGTGCGQDTAMGATQVPAPAGSDRPTSINLMPCRYDTWGNILIRLEAVPYPIPLMVLSGQGETVDIPVTVRVAGTSPLTPVKVVTASAPVRKGGPPRARTRRGGTDRHHGPAPPVCRRHAARGRAEARGDRRAGLALPRADVRPDPGHAGQPAAGRLGRRPRGLPHLRVPAPASRLVAERGDGAETAISVDF